MKILLAIDGSPCSEAAINQVALWPWPPHSEIRVVTVDAPVDPGLLRGGPANAFDEIINQQRAQSAKLLLVATAIVGRNPANLRVTTSLLEGWPKDAIVTEADRFGADVIVVGSHGYGPIRRFFLGSVSMFVAHHAPCSVLIVRQPPEISPPKDAPASA
jgi:nucleotide-binding universal stress UspA family protein